MLSPLASVAADVPVTLGVAVVFAGVLLSNATEPGAVREFLADNGLLMLTVGIVLAAVVGVGLFFVGNEELARQWLDQYGLLALFLIMILEGAMLLYFAPSETVVPVAVAALAESPSDYGTIAVIVSVSVVGATIGQSALFLLAKRGGREYLLQKRWFRIDESQLDRFDGWFDRWGPVAVPVSNALLFTRGMLTVPAGFAEMDERKFVALSAVGTLAFETILALVGPRIFEAILGFL